VPVSGNSQKWKHTKPINQKGDDGMHRFTSQEAERVLSHIVTNHLITFGQLQRAFSDIGISKLVKILQHLIKDSRITEGRSGGYFTEDDGMSGYGGTHTDQRPKCRPRTKTTKTDPEPLHLPNRMRANSHTKHNGNLKSSDSYFSSNEAEQVLTFIEIFEKANLNEIQKGIPNINEKNVDRILRHLLGNKRVRRSDCGMYYCSIQIN